MAERLAVLDACDSPLGNGYNVVEREAISRTATHAPSTIPGANCLTQRPRKVLPATALRLRAVLEILWIPWAPEPPLVPRDETGNDASSSMVCPGNSHPLATSTGALARSIVFYNPRIDRCAPWVQPVIARVAVLVARYPKTPVVTADDNDLAAPAGAYVLASLFLHPRVDYRRLRTPKHAIVVTENEFGNAVLAMVPADPNPLAATTGTERRVSLFSRYPLRERFAPTGCTAFPLGGLRRLSDRTEYGATRSLRLSSLAADLIHWSEPVHWFS
jgi:hypothetical protein